MPHKHTRKAGTGDNDHNLPPTAVARPLPAFNKDLQGKKHGKAGPQQKHGKAGPQRKQNASRRKTSSTADYREDDTPRAFARMMRFQQTGQKRRSGLDDGVPPRAAKKQKRAAAEESMPAPTPAAPKPKPDMPRIMPGERMGDFAARVDQALPLGGLARKGKTRIEGMKERQTKTEKRLHKMYAAWREDDARYKEKLEEMQEEEEEAEEERDAEMGGQALELPGGRKAKRKRMIGEQKGDADDDPWAELKAKREAPKGLHDVVQAPPTLKPVREKFKTRNGAAVDVANVPTASGSLKRREELGEARKEIIERYRAMMRGKAQ